MRLMRIVNYLKYSADIVQIESPELYQWFEQPFTGKLYTFLWWYINPANRDEGVKSTLIDNDTGEVGSIVYSYYLSF